MWICPECRSLHDDPLPTCDRDGTPLAEVTAHQSKARYPLLGKIVGDRYHLIGGLGQGGLGTVYLAKHRHLNQLFAVKFLEVETIVAPGAEDEAAVREQYKRDFLREAQVASLIRHDAVVRVSDFGEHGRMPFLVMEYVPGPSLLQVLGRQGRFEADEGLAIARRIAESLDAFHERRLVHRDLKPANVILDPRGNGRLTLVDLGLVKDLSGPGGKASTHPLALRGTPGYLAPEQVPSWVLAGAGVQNPGEKQPVDARVDLYALGVILYEMLAGVSPYPDGSNTQVIVYTCTKEPIAITAVDPPVRLPEGLVELIHDTMARDPHRRPQTAAAFLERLDRITMGLMHAGSWPQIMLPDRKRRDASGAEPEPRAVTAALLPPPEPAPADEPVATDESPALPDEEEHTVVYGSLNQLPPLIDRGDEEATMEADLDDSMAGLHDAPVARASASRHFASKPAQRITNPPQTVESAPPVAEPPSFAHERTSISAERPPQPSRAPAWIAAALVIAGATGAVWWLTRTPAPAREAVRLEVGAAPSAAPPAPSGPLTADAIAGARDEVGAPMSISAAASAPPGAPATLPDKPRAPASAARRHPKVEDPAPLLDRARRAFEEKDTQLALTLYQQALQRIAPDHQEYWAVRQRIDFLRQKLGQK